MAIFKNLKVIELASVLAGPSVGQFFAELGANVVKVENPNTNGDVTRTWKLPNENESHTVSGYFSAANWGKSSITLDVKKEEDLNAVYDLVSTADIVITSYKPGDAEKLKLDYATLSVINEKIIYGAITGYSSKDKVGYDAIIQAESGFMYMNGQKDALPTKMPVALMDILTAHQLKEGILVAMLNREKTGSGDFVEVSLFDSAISSLANQGTNWLCNNKNPERIGSEHPNIVPYGTVFKDCNGDELVLAVGSDKQFELLCQQLAIPNISSDSRYKTNPERVKNRDEIIKILQTEIVKMERNQLIDYLEKLKIPCGAINSIKDSLNTTDAQRLILKKDGHFGIKNIAFRTKNTITETNILIPPPFGYKIKK